MVWSKPPGEMCRDGVQIALKTPDSPTLLILAAPAGQMHERVLMPALR